MAKSLNSANIQTTVIQDSAVFPFMSRVNKVIIGCNTVLYSGGIRSFVGASNIASAASYNNVSVSICYNLCTSALPIFHYLIVAYLLYTIS